MSLSNQRRENKFLNIEVSDNLPSILNELKSNSFIKNVKFEFVTDDHDCFTKIASFLRETKSIEEVGFNLQNTTPATYEVIFPALKMNSSITSLSFEKGYSNDGSSMCSEAFIDCLTNNRTLRNIRLSNNRIGNADFEKVCFALRKNRTLRTLDLSFNIITAKGIENASPSLIVNDSLKNLYLNHNEVGDAGCFPLSMILRDNKGLKELYLRENMITKDGVKTLSSVLKKNTTLSSLDLRGNQINDDGCDHFISVIQENASLHTLKLSGNAIHSETARKILPALHKNSIMTNFKYAKKKIVYRYNYMSYEKRNIEIYCQIRKSLENNARSLVTTLINKKSLHLQEVHYLHNCDHNILVKSAYKQYALKIDGYLFDEFLRQANNRMKIELITALVTKIFCVEVLPSEIWNKLAKYFSLSDFFGYRHLSHRALKHMTVQNPVAEFFDF